MGAWKDMKQVVLWAGGKADLWANFVARYRGTGKKN